MAQTQLLFFSALAFVWLNRKGLYPPELRSTNLDVEWIYRRLAPGVLQTTFAQLSVVGELNSAFIAKLGTLSPSLARQFGGKGVFASSHPVGAMVKIVTVLLAVYLVLSFI